MPSSTRSRNVPTIFKICYIMPLDDFQRKDLSVQTVVLHQVEEMARRAADIKHFHETLLSMVPNISSEEGVNEMDPIPVPKPQQLQQTEQVLLIPTRTYIKTRQDKTIQDTSLLHRNNMSYSHKAQIYCRSTTFNVKLQHRRYPA